ncbi:PBP GOBP domain containing protein [Asbolus verrucosus]|uniref:PBP GOBP domain containing protein n=1 Tax=Asbolus verrucosus TaxID=1661398 RepID=A0A482V6N9_ASBVE|nr:PBP GOBP domain containing protein [Asbolus verrucosus]
MNLFVCLALIAVVGVQAMTDEQKEKLRKVGKECKEQSGVSQEFIDKVRKGEFVEDPKLKAQMLCVSKKVGLTDDSGNVNVEALRTKVMKVAHNDTDVDKIVEICTVKKDTPEDTAFFTYKCFCKSSNEKNRQMFS